MLLGKPYGKKIDIWALGILLYEILHLKAPYDEDLTAPEKMEIIKQGSTKLRFCEDLSVSVIDLIKKMLTRDPDQRIDLE